MSVTRECVHDLIMHDHVGHCPANVAADNHWEDLINDEALRRVVYAKWQKSPFNEESSPLHPTDDSDCTDWLVHASAEDRTEFYLSFKDDDLRS